MDLTDPELGFVEMARGMGINGVRITDPDEIGPAIHKGFSGGQPYLIDLVASGKT